MRQSVRTLMISLFLAALSACGNNVPTSSELPNTTDSDGLVEFHLPAGWMSLPGSQSSRFVRDGADRENAMIGVISTERHPSLAIDWIWENTKGKHEVQGQRIIREAARNFNGFEAREAVYEAERNGQSVVYHDYFLFSEDSQIEVHLNATKEAHERYEVDLETIAHSVRELKQDI